MCVCIQIFSYQMFVYFLNSGKFLVVSGGIFALGAARFTCLGFKDTLWAQVPNLIDSSVTNFLLNHDFLPSSQAFLVPPAISLSREIYLHL